VSVSGVRVLKKKQSVFNRTVNNRKYHMPKGTNEVTSDATGAKPPHLKKSREPKKPKEPVTIPAGVGALKIKEAAHYLGGISTISVRRMVKDGRIKPNRSLRVLLFPIAELDRFIAHGKPQDRAKR
jgi:hypothetical protein